MKAVFSHAPTVQISDDPVEHRTLASAMDVLRDEGPRRDARHYGREQQQHPPRQPTCITGASSAAYRCDVDRVEGVNFSLRMHRWRVGKADDQALA